MKHLALAVSDRERSRRFYETYFGFDAEPAREYDGGVLMLYNSDGFSLALGPTEEPIAFPPFLHFGVHLASAEDVRRFRGRLARARWSLLCSRRRRGLTHRDRTGENTTRHGRQ